MDKWHHTDHRPITAPWLPSNTQDRWFLERYSCFATLCISLILHKQISHVSFLFIVFNSLATCITGVSGYGVIVSVTQLSVPLLSTLSTSLSLSWAVQLYNSVSFPPWMGCANRVSLACPVEGSLEVEDFTSLQSVLSFIEPGALRKCGALSAQNSYSSNPRTRRPRLQEELVLLNAFIYSLDEMLKLLHYAFPYLKLFFSLRKHSQDHLFENYRCNFAVGSSPSLRDSAVNILQLLVFFCIWPRVSLFFFFLYFFLLSLSLPRGKNNVLWLLWEDRKSDICAFPQLFASCLCFNNSLKGGLFLSPSFFGNMKISSRAIALFCLYQGA